MLRHYIMLMVTLLLRSEPAITVRFTVPAPARFAGNTADHMFDAGGIPLAPAYSTGSWNTRPSTVFASTKTVSATFARLIPEAEMSLETLEFATPLASFVKFSIFNWSPSAKRVLLDVSVVCLPKRDPQPQY